MKYICTTLTIICLAFTTHTNAQTSNFTQLNAFRFKDTLRFPYHVRTFQVKKAINYKPYFKFINGKNPNKKYQANEITLQPNDNRNVIYIITRSHFIEQGFFDLQEAKIAFYAKITEKGLEPNDRKVISDPFRLKMDSKLINEVSIH